MKNTAQPCLPHILRPWTQAVQLNSDVESGNTSIAAYAIDLGSVIAGVKSIPKLYKEVEPFVQVTYPTSGMRRLMEEVLARLAGECGDRILQLRCRLAAASRS